MTTRRAAFLLWVFAFVVYAPSIFFDFDNFDTTEILTNHPTIFDEHSFLASLRAIFIHEFPREEPLLIRDVTWALDSRLWGFQNPMGYHFGNVVLNATNVALLYLFLLGATGRRAFAICAAIVFAVLPVHVEPVSWIMGRKDVLSTFCFLLALVLQQRRTRASYLATVVLVCFAALSKINGIVFFAVLVLADIFSDHLRGAVLPSAPIDWKNALVRIVPKYLPHALVSFLVFLWYKHALAAWGAISGVGTPPFSVEHLGTLAIYVPLVLALSMKLVFVPADYSISYGLPSLNVALSSTDWLMIGLTASLLPIALVWTYRKRKDVFFFIAFALIVMVPYLSIVYVGIWIANRYVYVASAGVIAIGLYAIPEKFHVRVTAFLAMLFLPANVFHQSTYADTEARWRYEVSTSEPSLQAFANLSALLIKQANAADEAHRLALLAEAESWLTAGTRQYEALPLVPTNYHCRNTQDYARILRFRGLLTRLRDEGPLAELTWNLKAHHVMPQDAHALEDLARIYFELAMLGDREANARRSFDFFAERVGGNRDPEARGTLIRQLETIYIPNFPLLRDEAEALAKRLRGQNTR